MDENMKLVIEIKNKKPVDVIDLAKFMMGIGGEYKSHIRDNYAHIPAEKISLYIKEVRQGSIITEMVPYAAISLPLFHHVNTVVSFGKNLISAFEWLSGKSDDRPDNLDRESLQNLSEIVDISAKDKGSQLNLHVKNLIGDVIVNHYHMNSTDANAIQNNARREIEESKEPVTGFHKKVLMYWDQAKNQQNNKSGDRARIDSIHHKGVRVVFESDDLKNQSFLRVMILKIKCYLIWPILSARLFLLTLMLRQSMKGLFSTK